MIVTERMAHEGGRIIDGIQLQQPFRDIDQPLPVPRPLKQSRLQDICLMELRICAYGRGGRLPGCGEFPGGRLEPRQFIPRLRVRGIQAYGPFEVLPRLDGVLPTDLPVEVDCIFGSNDLA